MKYYNIEKRCFTFPTKNQAINHINIYMPCVGVTQWLKSYIQRKNQRQESYDQDFITIAPMLISDYRKLNDNFEKSVTISQIFFISPLIFYIYYINIFQI